MKGMEASWRELELRPAGVAAPEDVISVPMN